jgi:RNA polymerase sigma-70 factor (ECF subfamily)
VRLIWTANRRGSGAGGARDPDGELLARVRAGEEQAFVDLVQRHQPLLLRLARSYVPSAAVAEEVTQETWLAVLRGLDGFEGRSSFKTWLLQILLNRARSTGVYERRTVTVADAGPAVDGSRFDTSGAWRAPPEHWVEEIDERLSAEQLASAIDKALTHLPDGQREVVLLRDVDGLSGGEVCDALQISRGNQRVLLHRARSRLRQALEDEVGGA